MNPRSLLRNFLFRYKWSYLLAMLVILASEILVVQIPNILGKFANAWKAGGLTIHLVVQYSLWLTVVGVIYVILYGIGQVQNGQSGRRFEYELRRRLFLHWETLSTAYFRKRSIGDLLNHAMNDVRQVRDAIAGGMNILANSIFLLITTLVMTFRTVNVELTIVSMIPLVFIPLFIIWLGPRIRNSSRAVQEGLSKMADLTEEGLSSIRLIKATANENIEVERFRGRVDDIVRRQLSLFRNSALFQSMIPMLGSISFAIALLYGGDLTLRGVIHIGAFVAFTLYLGMLMQPLQQIGFVINNFQRAGASLARLEVLLGEDSDIRDPRQPVQQPPSRGQIDIKLPEFRYEDSVEPALHDLELHVRPGQTLGIVGRTGAGKTTLVNLLPRIFDPPIGTVRIDGRDIQDYRLEDLRGAIAYVPQDGFLFSTTIDENIRFGNANATEDAVRSAAHKACIADEIERFTDGYQTIIGERGVTLSGGQRQRTAIARAFLKSAPILILDDSLSAVDMTTEKRILAYLKDVRSERTTLIVAHRLSAVQDADWIVVLDEGTMIEQGTHKDLIEMNGQYAATFRLQQTETMEVKG